MTLVERLQCPRHALHVANRLLLTGCALTLAGLTLAYGLDSILALPILVAAHALTVIGPGLLKIGYVMRLLAQGRLQGFEGEVCCVVA
ncbi:transmembrane sensor/regulator PpyR [Pseudomonas sp. RIT-PI-AD]|uniref:transmembrane sensor/regulator PpyR n=1 Tax=Pseudomonas sp. RIT-PI-AD TaxID=3035294 RepID=UPI0021DA531E|nr:transmembrane sensor/regulator PpyR [Pseudomonas sp. RIT-PI-AD]